MGAPPLLHTLSGRDRFLKNIQLLVLCLRLSGEGYCKYETVISRDKEDKEEEWEVIIHLLNNDFAQQEYCIEGPSTKNGFVKDFSNSRRIGNNVRYNKSSLNQRGCHVF